MWESSPVYDEEVHIAAGLVYWKHGGGKFNYQQPPLVKILAGAPLLAMGLDTGDLPDTERQVEFARFAGDFLARNKDRLDLVVFLARLPLALLSAAAGIMVFAWAREAYGLGAAFMGLLLYVFEPNLLGHSGLVFMDAPLAALSLFSVYALWRWCRRPDTGRMLAAGTLLGLALLTKFPALALMPAFAFLAAMEFLRRRRAPDDPARARYAKGLLGMYITAAVIVLGTYGTFFGTERLLDSDRPSYALSILRDLTQRLPGGMAQPAAAALKYLAEHTPVVGMDYVRGLVWQREHLGWGMPSFLLGQHSEHGWWYFHFIAVGLKTTVPMLALVGLRLLLLRRLPWRPLESFLAVPALITLGLSMASPLGSGLRYVLPAYPFLIILASGLAAVPVVRRRLWIGLLVALVVWHAISSLRTFPYYIAYFNELAGGPAGGHRYLVGSNLDFGQDLKRLAHHLRKRGQPTVYLSLHTTVEPALYGIRSLPLPADGGCRTGTIAVSATQLQGVPFENKQAFNWLKAREPSASIGHSIFVYEIDRCP